MLRRRQRLPTLYVTGIERFAVTRVLRDCWNGAPSPCRFGLHACTAMAGLNRHHTISDQQCVLAS